MKTICWGILSTGVIAKTFADTIGKMTEKPTILAVASRVKESANEFADQYGIERRYDSYEALAKDPDVDIVYVGTPHSRHYEDMKLMIENGKSVLCEKSFTTDAAQAQAIFDLAREKGVFVMEAFWTKLLPIYREVERVIASGEIGKIHAVTAQYGYTTPREARKFDPSLAGGTLLDIGVYAIGFACMFLGYEFDSIKSNLVMNSVGTDAIDAMLLRKGDAVAQLTTAIGMKMPLFGAIYGTKGHIDIPDFKNPQKVTVCVDGQMPYDIERSFEVNGFEYEIREAEVCMREGKLESGVMTQAQSVATMKIMDEIRLQNNFEFNL